MLQHAREQARRVTPPGMADVPAEAQPPAPAPASAGNGQAAGPGPIVAPEAAVERPGRSRGRTTRAGATTHPGRRRRTGVAGEGFGDRRSPPPSALLGAGCPAEPATAAPGNGQAVATLLLDAEALARELNLSLRTIRRLDLTGAIPRSVRVGRAVRWRRAEVVAWCAAGCPPRDSWNWLKE